MNCIICKQIRDRVDPSSNAYLCSSCTAFLLANPEEGKLRLRDVQEIVEKGSNRHVAGPNSEIHPPTHG